MWHCLDYPCRNHFLHLLPFPFIHVQLVSPTSFSMDSLEKSIPSSSQLEFAGSYNTDRGVWMIHGMSSHSHTPGRSWILAAGQRFLTQLCILCWAIPRNFPPGSAHPAQLPRQDQESLWNFHPCSMGSFPSNSSCSQGIC